MPLEGSTFSQYTHLVGMGALPLWHTKRLILRWELGRTWKGSARSMSSWWSACESATLGLNLPALTASAVLPSCWVCLLPQGLRSKLCREVALTDATKITSCAAHGHVLFVLDEELLWTCGSPSPRLFAKRSLCSRVNHISPASDEFQDFLARGDDSKTADMWIDWEKFWPKGAQYQE